jgi:hypothetical protein
VNPGAQLSPARGRWALDGWDSILSARPVLRNVVRYLCRPRASLAVVTALTVLAACLPLNEPAWPEPLAPGEPATASVRAEALDDALVRAQPVCVLSTLDSAGELGRSLLVRHRREGDRLWVSYFAYWSSERPWGDEPFLVSLAIDAVYSHFLFALPGLRHALYGPGDVEGVTVVYRVRDGRLEIIEGYADDQYHRAVQLGPEDLGGSDNHTLLMTSWWSHQLGGRGAARAAGAAVSRRCFVGSALVPLTAETAERFRLGSADRPLRARRAWL